jgi:hypothetical protein
MNKPLSGKEMMQLRIEQRKDARNLYLKQVRSFLQLGIDCDEKLIVLVDFNARTSVKISIYRSGTTATRERVLERIRATTGDLPEVHYDLVSGLQEDLLKNNRFWLVAAPARVGGTTAVRKFVPPKFKDFLSVHPLDHFMSIKELAISEYPTEEEFKRLFRR